MPKTPLKQPVAADLDYVDVEYIQRGGTYNSLTISTCAIWKYSNSFINTVIMILRDGIYAEDDSWFIPPSAIIKIRDRKEKS